MNRNSSFQNIPSRIIFQNCKKIQIQAKFAIFHWNNKPNNQRCHCLYMWNIELTATTNICWIVTISCQQTESYVKGNCIVFSSFQRNQFVRIGFISVLLLVFVFNKHSSARWNCLKYRLIIRFNYVCRYNQCAFNSLHKKWLSNLWMNSSFQFNVFVS